MLRMPEPRVRELARDALVGLAPITAQRVEDDWRGQLADYVLGQQGGPESTATRGHLRRSEAARAWARSLLDSLDTFYEDGVPSIPDGDRAAGRSMLQRAPSRWRRPGPPDAAAERRRGLSAEARAALRRRRLLGAGALGLVALVAVLLWPIGLLTGDDDQGGGSTQAAGRQPASSGSPAGIAVVAQQGGRRQVVVQAANLPPSTRREAYEVWLYNSPQDAKSIGAQVTDKRGAYQGAGPLPDDYARFRFIDVSREPIDQNRAHSGQSVLRGRLGTLKQPPPNADTSKAVVLGQVVLTPPR